MLALQPHASGQRQKKLNPVRSTVPASLVYFRPPACTPPPFHCLGKQLLYNIISFSSTFKIQEFLFSLQTCTFLKKRRFSEDVVFQKSTSRQHGSTRFRIRRLPEATHDKSPLIVRFGVLAAGYIPERGLCSDELVSVRRPRKWRDLRRETSSSHGRSRLRL